MADLSALYLKGKGVENIYKTAQNGTAAQIYAGETTQNQLLEQERAKNNGGFFGGIGYAFEKIGLGFLSGIEGIWDYTAGGLAKLFGADDWAEQQFANDWVNYNHADEWFNPSEGWKVAGDVAGGIGTSLPAIAGVVAGGAIAYFSGGTLSPLAAGMIAGSIAGLGAAGRATKEAYDQTGELGGKEFGYGALVGVTEGTIEGVSSLIGAGTGAVVKNVAKSFGKEVAETATRQTLMKGIVKGFAGEAFEEGVATILEPYWKRLTYDPNAKNATIQEVGYAALIGGLSGAIMGGADISFRNIASTNRGTNIVESGTAGDVISTAEQISNYQTENQTDFESFQLVKNTLAELQNSMQSTGGQVQTLKQRMLLGVLERANTSAAFEPIISSSAENIYNNAETVAARLNELGYTDQNGKALQVTAEQLREGIDTTNEKTFRKSMSNALKANSALRTLAVADAVGQLSLDTARFKDATLRGQHLATQADLNRFIEQATDAERQAVADRLGIESWETLTNDVFQSKITEFVANGGIESYQQEHTLAREAEAVAPESAKKTLPRMVNLRNDGIYRYSQNGTDIAIIKRGDTYYVYDYESKRMSKPLRRTETNKVLREIHTNEQNYTESVKRQTEAQNKLKEQAAELDTFARENISDYKNASSSGQAAIRAVIRQGRALGLQEDFVLSCARVSARSGLRIVFSKEASFVAENGSYADGAIDLKNNRIIINPEAKKRTGEMILIHELTHAIYNLSDGTLQVADGVDAMTAEEKEKIRKRYAAVGRGGAVQVGDEINAHFAEQTLSNKNILERLVEKKPKLKDKILGFFKKARADYRSDEKLSGAAARLYRQYKKLFDDFAMRNQRYLGTENSTVTVDTQQALPETLERLGKYTNDEIASIETTKLFKVARSYADVKAFIAKATSMETERRLFLGKINAETAAKIQAATGLNVDGKSIALSSSDIKHILSGHGDAKAESPMGQIAVTQENFESIIETIIDPDTIERSDAKGQVGIVFTKEIDGKVTAITIVSEKKKALTLKSAWITKKKQSTSPTPDVKSPSLTSETGRRIKTVSDNSISENTKKVNSESQKGKKFALAGQTSETADLSMLDRAKQLQAAGEDSETIRKETGWFVGYDNQWRYEIDDSASILVEKPAFQNHSTEDGGYRTAKLGDIMHHEKLYAAYPFLKDITVILQETNTGVDGTAFAADGQIVLDQRLFTRASKEYLQYLENRQPEIKRIEQTAAFKEYNRFYEDESLQETLSAEEWLAQEETARNKFFASELGKKYHNLMWGKPNVATTELGWSDRAKSVLMHEVQHLIQSREGFASGASDTYWYNRLLKQYRGEAETAREKFLKLRIETTPELRQAMYDMEDTLNRFDISTFTIAKAYDNAARYAKNNSQREILWDYAQAHTKLSDFYKNGRRYASDMYTTTAGEVEARDVSQRLEMTAEQRRETRPDIDRKRVYFSEKNGGNSERRFAEIEQEAVDLFGHTYSWSETGYILTDGARLDFSGRHEGARGGYRTVDHRDISQIEAYSEYSGNEAMIDFMKRGNIRIMPEGGGVNLSVLPTKAQETTLSDFISRNRGEILLDIDNEIGDTIISVEYPKGTHSSKVLQDIRKYFEDGIEPTVSEVFRFRYALPETDNTGASLSQEQREFFKDSKVVDEQGRLLRVYHGTSFDGIIGEMRQGNLSNGFLWATSFLPEAENYSRAPRNGVQSRGGQIIALYADIKNPKYADAGKKMPYDPESFIEILNDKENDGYIISYDLPHYWSYFDEPTTVESPDYYGLPIGTNLKDVYERNNGKMYVVAVRKSSQFKRVDNRTPSKSSDIRFAIDSSDTDNQTYGGYSVGQRARFAANNTGMRVYTKAEAAEVINSIVEERLVFDRDGLYGELRGKDRQEVVDYLFKKLNTAKEGYRTGVALKIADFLIEHTLLTDMYADTYSSEAMRVLSVLRGYMHGLDLKSLKGEIEYKFDKKNSVALVWGAKEGGTAVDTIPQELAEQGIYIEATNEADILFEMLEMYDTARREVNTATEKLKLSEYGSAKTIRDLRQQIARDILNAYEQKGSKSKYARLVERYTKEIATLRTKLREANTQNRLINSIVDRAQKMRDLKLGTFLNSTQYKSDVFKRSIETLAKLKYRGNFNIAGTRKVMAELRTWYTKENPVLADTYEQGIADMLDEIAGGTKGYTKTELQMINDVMAYFVNYVEKFNKVYRSGKWIDAVPEATRYIDVVHANEQVKVGLFRKMVGSTYMQTFGDPMTVARRMDMYESGFYTEMLTELRDAAIDAQISEMEVKADYDAFMQSHKKYLTEATKQTVKYRGVDIPRMHLIGLYMTLKRAHAQAGLAQNGFAFVDKDGKRVRVQGFASDIIEENDLRAAAIEEQTAIAGLLTSADKEYVAILEKAFNEDAKKLKADRDMQRLGFTNATEDYYYPIRRGNISKNVDTSDIQGELDRVSSSSFNKDTVRGAKQELFIESADAVFNRHIRAVCQYAALSPAIETYNRLYNLDISGNPNKPVSVATESANTWSKGNKYFSKLISDIQGIPASSSEGMKLLGSIRGNYAKFQLGANPKVWITQLSSIFSSSSILDANSLTRGMFVSANGVDTYCPLAKLRNSDNTAAMAQGVLDKAGKVSNVLMAPIGKMDRFVIRRLFGACQVQVQKNGGAKIGTEANKVEAGKLLKRVILETQQNSLATERSAAMRSGNEVLRTLTMFSADAMKVVGRVIDSVGELSTLRAKLRTTTDTAKQAELRTQIKSAQKKVFKSVTALATSALFMVGVAQLFKWLYNKDKDEDETAAQEVIVDFLGNLIGGLPLIRDVYSRIAEGYSIDSYAYSALNDLLDSAVRLFDGVGNFVSGEATEQQIAAGVKSLIYSVGQLFGIPTRNIYNVVYGLTKRISPTSAYKIDEKFYKKNYVTDLNKAIENDDTDMIVMLMEMILGERVSGGTVSDTVRDKLSDLYGKGYSVLPRVIGDTITYNNETIPLSGEQYDRFKAIYSQAMKDLEKMIDNGILNSLSEERQAKAIKQVYDAHYRNALTDLVGVDERTTVGILSRWIDIGRLSVAFTEMSDISSDTNSKGETVAGSKKKNTIEYLLKQNLSDGERLLILCYRGYSIQDGDYKKWSAVRAKRLLLKYILGLRATQAEKAEIAKKCGFTVRNNKIIRDF